MVEALFVHLSLFPQQLWQALRKLGRQVLAGIMTLVMPIGVLLGLAAQPERFKSAMLQPATNLIDFTPIVPYRTVPRSEAADRRGSMSEARADRERSLTLVIPAGAEVSSAVFQLPVFQLPVFQPPVFQPPESTPFFEGAPELAFVPFFLAKPVEAPYTTLLPVELVQQD